MVDVGDGRFSAYRPMPAYGSRTGVTGSLNVTQSMTAGPTPTTLLEGTDNPKLTGSLDSC